MPTVKVVVLNFLWSAPSSLPCSVAIIRQSGTVLWNPRELGKEGLGSLDYSSFEESGEQVMSIKNKVLSYL